MATITVDKKEYSELKKRAEAFNNIIASADPDMLLQPTVRSRKEVIRQLKATKKYSQAFLRSISRGLGRSDYFTK